MEMILLAVVTSMKIISYKIYKRNSMDYLQHPYTNNIVLVIIIGSPIDIT